MIPSKAARAWTRSMARAAMINYGGGDTDWLFGDDDQDDLFGEDGMTSCMAETAMISLMAVR